MLPGRKAATERGSGSIRIMGIQIRGVSPSDYQHQIREWWAKLCFLLMNPTCMLHGRKQCCHRATPKFSLLTPQTTEQRFQHPKTLTIHRPIRLLRYWLDGVQQFTLHGLRAPGVRPQVRTLSPLLKKVSPGLGLRFFRTAQITKSNWQQRQLLVTLYPTADTRTQAMLGLRGPILNFQADAAALNPGLQRRGPTSMFHGN